LISADRPTLTRREKTPNRAQIVAKVVAAAGGECFSHFAGY